MQVIILCEGYGTRLRSIISDRPKPLAPIAGKPFLEHIIKWLVKYNYKDVIFCVSYKSEQIINFVGDGKKLGIRPIFSKRPSPSGTGGAIKYASKYLNNRDKEVLIINGDTFFDINLDRFFDFHRKNKSHVTIALSHVLDVHRYGQVKVDQNFQLLEFKEKSQESTSPQAGLVNGGVYIFNPEVFKMLKKITTPFSIERDFFSVKISELRMFGYTSDTTHYDMGTPFGYRRAERALSGQDDILIRSRAPLRLSFGGGGTDISPFDQKFGGCVLNGTINKYVYGLLKLRDDRKIRLVSSDYRLSIVYDDVKNLPFDGHLDLIKGIVKRINIDYGFELFIRSDVPPHSGMGSSASVCAAVIGLFNHLLVESKMTKSQIAELAFRVETEDLKNQGGRQDQYAAVYGGFNFFEFFGNDLVKVSPLSLQRNIFLELEKNLVLAYLGERGPSGKHHGNGNVSQNKKDIYLKLIKNLGYEAHQSLIRGDLNRFGYILEETWQLKKKAFPYSTNANIDNIYDQAKKAGAVGGRVTGAGGGGHIMFYCKPGTEYKVTKAVAALGAKIVDFSFDLDGLQTWEV